MKSNSENRRDKHLLRTIVIGAAVLLVLAGTLKLLSRQDLQYLVKDSLSHIGTQVTLAAGGEEENKQQKLTIAELKKTEKVQFDQALLLVNTAHPLPAGYEAAVEEYGDSEVMMNPSVSDAYTALKEAVKAQTEQPLYIESAYRSEQEQAQVKAEEGDTAQEVGASEHQTGLALDVYTKNFAGKGFLQSRAGLYVNKYCAEFGFVIRYPYYGTSSTGIGYEPWHIRYVGKPHADIMTRNSLTLEEYLEELKIGEFYEYDGYVISRQSGDTLTVPAHFKSLTISPDNMGNYVVTARI